jgi:hypothetical protein
MSRSEGLVCDASLVPLWGWLWHSLTQSAVVAVRSLVCRASLANCRLLLLLLQTAVVRDTLCSSSHFAKRKGQICLKQDG